MCVQDPPMCLTWPTEGDRINLDKYEVYSESGKYVSMCVWPAVLLQDRGKVLSKGSVIAAQKWFLGYDIYDKKKPCDISHISVGCYRPYLYNNIRYSPFFLLELQLLNLNL